MAAAAAAAAGEASDGFGSTVFHRRLARTRVAASDWCSEWCVGDFGAHWSGQLVLRLR